MPDPSYVIETHGRQEGLAFHLSTAFYPPLPDEIKEAFIRVFVDYWSGDIDLGSLDQELADKAGYTGGVNQYNFWQFLNDEDLD